VSFFKKKSINSVTLMSGENDKVTTVPAEPSNPLLICHDDVFLEDLGGV
jgi:hypothetical protein